MSRWIYRNFHILGITLLFSFLAFVIFVFSLPEPHDDTDPAKSQSGLRLYIDNKTGCHYLSTGNRDGITPRLDSTGKQICAGGAP